MLSCRKGIGFLLARQEKEAAMAYDNRNDNIRVKVLDSRDEFRPGRNGGSVNWPRFVSGALLLIFGLICVFSPLAVLAGFAAIVACVIIASGAVSIVSYMRSRNTMFAQSGWNLFCAVMIVVFGVVLLAFPMIGVATVAWMFGLGIIVFGAVQIFTARRLSLFGGGMWGMLMGAGILEVILGILLCVFPAYLGVFIGLFAIVHAIDMIVFSLPIGRDRSNGLW